MIAKEKFIQLRRDRLFCDDVGHSADPAGAVWLCDQR